jgi:hypothetical protein
MPAVVVFTTGAPGGKVDRVRVREDADAVVEKLSASRTGFADFSSSTEPPTAVWINRDQVRMVRESPATAGEPEDDDE